MKYNPIEANIPEEMQEEINQKIMTVINSIDRQGISNEDIYNSWSQKGGQHGLNFADFDNRHAYTGAKKALEEGQFFTPDKVCEFIIKLLQIQPRHKVGDLTYGKGSFINATPTEGNFYGCEIDARTATVARTLFPSANLENMDIFHYTCPVRLDFIVGNPPFNLKIGGMESQLFYFIKAAEALKPGGLIAIVVPYNFLQDDYADKTRRKIIAKEFGFITQFALMSDTFNVGIDTKVMVWQKDSEAISGDLFDNKMPTLLEAVTAINIALAEQKKAHALLAKEYNRSNQINYYSFAKDGMVKKKSKAEGEEEYGFLFKKKKYLYELKAHPQFKDKIEGVNKYLRRFKEQVIPKNLSAEALKKWMATEYITERKVLAYLKRALKPSLIKAELSIDKDNNTRRKVRTKNPKGRVVSVKKQKRKLKLYEQQQQQWVDMKQSKKIALFLQLNIIHKNIVFTKIQREDINLTLQKRSSFLQWQQGGGKTLAGISHIDYRRVTKQAEYSFVVAPAIAIKNNWSSVLPDFNRKFIIIKEPSDIAKIKPGIINLITLNTATKDEIKTLLKKKMRAIKNKSLLVFDESDSISNVTAKRTKSIYAIFHKAKYKLLLTGTATRNNIAESFSQFALMYGSTENFKSMSAFVYAERDKEIRKIVNKRQGKPFHVYTRGALEFKREFNPEKETVFGAKKLNQDIYNATHLKRLLGYSLITRTIEEIAGRKLYEIVQETVRMNEAERALYKIIASQFEKVHYKYFKSTGNSRKDSMLKILFQLNLLLKACSTPHLFGEYTGTGCSTKYRKIIKMIANEPNHLAIGCTRVATVKDLAAYIGKVFPKRKLFIATGGDTTLARRKAMIEEMRNTPGSILISTQQAFKSSMNIDFVDTCILPELDWNDAKMSQYYFRFIRFTSKRKTKVHFITYENSLESNLLQLILNKERLNRFMKGQEGDEEMNEKYGITFNLIDMLCTKEKSQSGRTIIAWDKQTIAE